jgi:hypothetical protein
MRGEDVGFVALRPDAVKKYKNGEMIAIGWRGRMGVWGDETT